MRGVSDDWVRSNENLRSNEHKIEIISGKPRRGMQTSKTILQFAGVFLTMKSH